MLFPSKNSRRSFKRALPLKRLTLLSCAIAAGSCFGGFVDSPFISQPAYAAERFDSETLSGIDVLAQQNYAPLRGKRIGLVTNQTGVNKARRSTIDVLVRAPGVKLAALFSPEHGLRGTATAGQHVSNGRDTVTGLPVYSLYGGTRRPSASVLNGLNALVFDLQDIGARSYTYISTLGQCMEACAAAGIPLIVLDRPNPLGGERMEGNLPTNVRSFVCPYPIPYRHGLTMGELARMINGRGWLRGGRKCSLSVIAMQGYHRAMPAAQSGLPWVQTSPNIPFAHSPYFYTSTGIIGELSSVSIGVGTSAPFEVVGAPGINARALADNLNARRLNGCRFSAIQWRPTRGAFRGRTCAGVRIQLEDGPAAELTRLNFEIMDAIRKVNPGFKLFGSSGRSAMFDTVCGSSLPRQWFAAGKTSAQIWAAWNNNAKFTAQRRPYLLYS
jgi:uncharacterized protein YbbC (DUF1343 family)